MFFLISLGLSGLIDVVRLIIFNHWLSASQPAEDLSARLVVDGVPYRESIGSYALLSRHTSSGTLERDLVLNLQVRIAMQMPNTPALRMMIEPINRVVVSSRFLMIDDTLVVSEKAILKVCHSHSHSHPTTKIGPYSPSARNWSKLSLWTAQLCRLASLPPR